MSLTPIIIVGMLFIGLPWVVLHYVTSWKTAATLTDEDEVMLDQMLETARRLDERLQTIERIIAADNPDFRPDFRPDVRPDVRPDSRPSPTASAAQDYSFQRRD